MLMDRFYSNRGFRLSCCLFLAILCGMAYYSGLWTRRTIIRQTYELHLHNANLLMLLPVRPKEQKRVAICLVGGARAFELTGPSIKKYLLDYYRDADVFIHAPVDANVYKLSLLQDVPSLASIRLFVPHKLNETQIAREVLRATDSPNGIQGLLQYFKLVEGCLDMTKEYEALYGFKYDWIIRTRLDGYWNAPMPPIHTFNSSKYYVPYGSGFGGLNDRLGVGTRETSEVALSRLTLLSKIHDLGHRGLNSERAFKAQLQCSNVEVEFTSFPFCILSKRNYATSAVPVASIQSKGLLNGAKCRPCTPTLVGQYAWDLLKGRESSSGWIAHAVDPQLCNARYGWENNWEQIYDKVSGPEMAQLRKSFTNGSVAECVQEMQSFKQQWNLWDSPSAELLCASYVKVAN